MPFLAAKMVMDNKDHIKKLMLLCPGREYKRHPISICARYCKQFFGGLRLGGVECKWHTSDGEVTFTTREEQLPDAGDTSSMGLLFDAKHEAAPALFNDR